MKSKIVISWFAVGTFALFGFGWMVHASSFMAGVDEGDKVGYERGFKAGQVHEGITNEKLVKRLEAMFPVKEEKLVKDYWEVRYVGEKVVLFSTFSAPPLMKEFGIDRTFHYIYDENGVYAFPTEDFELKDIMELVGPQKDESFQKL